MEFCWKDMCLYILHYGYLKMSDRSCQDKGRNSEDLKFKIVGNGLRINPSL